jgi:hypothetical protein
MDKKLITEINRIKEIISGKKFLLENVVPPKLSQEIFDFALRQGDEFLEFIRPLAQKEAQRIGAVTDDLVDMFDKQIGDYINGYSTVRQFSDDSVKLILRNATTEEFVEFLLKSKIIPASIDNVTSEVIKKVAELGRRGTPVPEGYIDDTVKNYEDKLELLDWLGDEIKEGLVLRYRKQLNQARVPYLTKVGLQVTPEAVMRHALGEGQFNNLMKYPEVARELKTIQNAMIGKTWQEAVNDTLAHIKFLESSDVLKKNMDPSKLGFFRKTLDQIKNGLLSYRREPGSKDFYRGPDGNLAFNLPKTAWIWISIMFMVSLLTAFLKEGSSGPIKLTIGEIMDVIIGFSDVTQEVRKEYSIVSEEEGKKYLQTLGLNLKNYSFEKDPKDEYKMIALYVGEGEGPDYLIYKKDKVLGHKVYTEEDRNKSFFDILQKFK